jgi:hypothetical protein
MSSYHFEFEGADDLAHCIKEYALERDELLTADAQEFKRELLRAIEPALTQARLEGAKAMQEKASGLGKHMVNLLPVGIPDVDSPLYKIAQNNITTYSKLITNLDPQQVINESMGDA